MPPTNLNRMAKRKLKLLIIVSAKAGSTAGRNAARAQLFENHYLVYQLYQEFTYSLPIVLSDQFGEGTYPLFIMDHFANPVEKNGEPIVAPEVHQTWWRIDDPQPQREVTLENQFGSVHHRQYFSCLHLPAGVHK